MKNSSIYCLILCASYISASQQTVLPKEKPAIAFDLHGVLTKMDVWRMVKTIVAGLWKEPSLIFKLHPQTFKSGAYVDHPTLLAIYNSYKPRPEMLELARKLKAAGHPIYLFSNINDKAFDALRADWPGAFDIFDACHVTTKNNPTLRKPAPEAYTSCKVLIASQFPTKNIIFIDDKKKNIVAGAQQGMHGILFKNLKNLKKQLAEQSVTVE